MQQVLLVLLPWQLVAVLLQLKPLRQGRQQLELLLLPLPLSCA
jgi:hypothetical protein